MTKIVLLNKPFGVLPQFTDLKSPTKRETLSDFVPIPNIYPAGRLDRDSEGLMILTDSGLLQARIADPKYKLAKTYLVQVEGDPQDADIAPLRTGIQLKDGKSKPANVRLIDSPKLWERDPPIRVRKNIPDRWLELIIREGRNRQVRRMTAAIGFPTLRLVRVQVGEWTLNDLQPGQWRESAF